MASEKGFVQKENKINKALENLPITNMEMNVNVRREAGRVRRIYLGI